MTFTITQDLFYIAISLVLLAMQIYQSVKTDKLKKEVDALKNIVLIILYSAKGTKNEEKEETERTV